MLRYDDGTEGVVDLSDMVGSGVFEAWEDDAFFDTVHVADHGAIAWDETIELCPVALYLEISGASPEDLLPRLKAQTVA